MLIDPQISYWIASYDTSCRNILNIKSERGWMILESLIKNELGWLAVASSRMRGDPKIISKD